MEKLHMLERGATAHDDREAQEPQMVFGCAYLAVAFGQFTTPISQWQF